MKLFVEQNSIVRKIWGKADTVLFIFAGSAAEFALNKAVDWLYFTGKLPADPLGRLFSTVEYARQIIFSDYDHAVNAIDRISAIHASVEQARGQRIPDWAYRDVLFMLIDYSIRSFEMLERTLTEAEKADVFRVFNNLGRQMNRKGLPDNYQEWKMIRDRQLQQDLMSSAFTIDLYKQYLKHLGPVRYFLLKQVRLMVCPRAVKQMLSIGKLAYLLPAFWGYKLIRVIKLEGMLKNVLLPAKYKAQILALDVQ